MREREERRERERREREERERESAGDCESTVRELQLKS